MHTNCYFGLFNYWLLDMVTQESLEKAIAICKEFGVEQQLLFGSAAKSFKDATDIDLAIEGQSKGDILDLAIRLEEEVDVRVDLVKLYKDDRFSDHIRQTGRLIHVQ